MSRAAGSLAAVALSCAAWCAQVSAFAMRNSQASKATWNIRSGCPKGWIKESGACFKYYPAKKTWAEAEAQCILQGAHLATLETAEQRAALRKLATAANQVLVSSCTCQSSSAMCTGTDADCNRLQ